MFKDFPSLHPLIVHFPLVLILLAVPFQLAVVWKNWQQIRWATLGIMTLAFLSALAASTIFHAEPTDDAPKDALMMFALHEKFAFLTLWMSGITLGLKLIGDLYKISYRSYDVLVFVSAIISAILLSIAGHHGAKLTHVAGVGPMGRYLMKEHGGMNENDTTMKMNDMDNMQKDNSSKLNDTFAKMQNMSTIDSMQKMNMNAMNDNKNASAKNNETSMGTMKGMDKPKKDMKNMEGMGTMEGMDKPKNDMKNMEGMGTMKGMDNIRPTKANAMDTLSFEDNNPARKKTKSKK